jgi:hypothetical protein
MDTFAICKKNTMVPQAHMLYLQSLIDQLNMSKIPGDFIECGVWKGGCVMWMLECQKRHNMNRNVFLYDTFAGMTYPGSEKDDPQAKKIWIETQENKYHRDYDKWHGQNKWAYCPLEDVRRNISSVGYDSTKVKYIVGDVCETLNKPANIPNQIAILRLDTDWYQSTKKELDVLFSHVVKNGYVIIDDYYAWKGSKTATDEFFKSHPHVQIIDPHETGQIMVFKNGGT